MQSFSFAHYNSPITLQTNWL